MLFNLQLKEHKYKTALFNENTKITYSEINQKSKFLKKKIKKRTLILILCENNIENIFYYLTFTKIRNPLILIDEKTPLKQIQNIIKLYKPKYTCLSKKNFDYLKLNKKKIIDELTETLVVENKKFTKYQIYSQLFLLLSTSGTTGASKFVRLSYKNILDNTKKIINFLKIKKNDVAITNMPYCYSYMLSVINTHISKGASIFVTNKSLLNREFWLNYKKYKITSFNGVAYIYEILNKINLKKIFNKNLKYITQAGGELDFNLKKKILKILKKNKVPFYIMYGQTEASPRISCFNALRHENKLNSIGRPLPGYKMFIKDERGNIVKKNLKKGVLYIEGNNVCLGYAKSFLDLKKKDTNKKKLLTNDLCYFDKDGFFYYVGRNNRVVKILGNRFDLNDLDLKLKKINYKVITKVKNEKIIIYFEKNYKKNFLLNKIYSNISLNKNLIILKKVKKFPINSNGKIDITKIN